MFRRRRRSSSTRRIRAPGSRRSRSTVPDQLNIPTIGARRRYGDLIFKASIDDDVKVLVVRGVGDHLGTGADLDELMAKRAPGHRAARGVRDRPRTTTSRCRRPALVPGRRVAPALVRQRPVGLPQPPGVQEDQHPRGQGLLLRLALLPSGGRRPRDLVRRRAVRPPRLPLRRLRAAHVAVGDDDGAAQVPGDGVHRPPVHRRADVRLQLPEQRRAPRRARGRGREVRARRAPGPGRPTPSSCRRSSSRS